jgi:hypothetical protein
MPKEPQTPFSVDPGGIAFPWAYFDLVIMPEPTLKTNSPLIGDANDASWRFIGLLCTPAPTRRLWRTIGAGLRRNINHAAAC